MKNIKTISISGVISLNLHSLNNEKGEQNVIVAREYKVVDPAGKTHTLGGISGNMMKHVLVEHLLEDANESHLEVCDSCRVMNPNRISDSHRFAEEAANIKDYKEIQDLVLKLCSIDDMAGMMHTGEPLKFGRKSVVELSEVSAIPRQFTSERKLALKLAKDPQAHKSEGERSKNAGSNLIHRPVNSANYAIQMHIEADRISMNDVDFSYPVSDEERKERYEALLRAVYATFTKLAGANRATQMPHMSDFKGVITYSTSSLPAPMLSPLFNPEGFFDGIDTLVQTNNQFKPDTTYALHFSSLQEFGSQIFELAQHMPGKK